MAHKFLERNEGEKALALGKMAEEEDYNSFEPLNLQGLALEKMGKWQESLAWWKRIIKERGGNENGYIYLDSLFNHKGVLCLYIVKSQFAMRCSQY